MTKSDAQMIAEYDQESLKIAECWETLPEDELKRIMRVVLPSLEAKGDAVASALLRFAIATLKVRQIEKQNRDDE